MRKQQVKQNKHVSICDGKKETGKEINMAVTPAKLTTITQVQKKIKKYAQASCTQNNMMIHNAASRKSLVKER